MGFQIADRLLVQIHPSRATPFEGNRQARVVPASLRRARKLRAAPPIVCPPSASTHHPRNTHPPPALSPRPTSARSPALIHPAHPQIAPFVPYIYTIYPAHTRTLCLTFSRSLCNPIVASPCLAPPRPGLSHNASAPSIAVSGRVSLARPTSARVFCPPPSQRPTSYVICRLAARPLGRWRRQSSSRRLTV